MSRRTKLIILIVVTLLLLALGLWFLFRPFFGPEQPPAPSGPGTPSFQPSTTTEPVRPPQGTRVPQDIKQLEDLAVSVVTRIGSGSNTDGFRGYEDVLLNATAGFQTELQRLQSAMQGAHPEIGDAYGVTTRVVSVDSRDAVSGAERISMTLQTQRAEDAGNPGSPTAVSYLEAIVTFQRQADGSYLVDTIVWSDIVR